MQHLDAATLTAGLSEVRASPTDVGTVELIVRRPAIDARELIDEAELSRRQGVVGDTWDQRPSRRSADGGPHPDMQLNIMNARAATLIAGDPDRRALAGDQLYLDLDLSSANLPPGTQLALGTAVIEITEQPHTGCAKFASRFGRDALAFVNSEVGRELNLRGVNARVVVDGRVRVGDEVRRISPASR